MLSRFFLSSQLFFLRKTFNFFIIKQRYNFFFLNFFLSFGSSVEFFILFDFSSFFKKKMLSAELQVPTLLADFVDKDTSDDVDSEEPAVILLTQTELQNEFLVKKTKKPRWGGYLDIFSLKKRRDYSSINRSLFLKNYLQFKNYLFFKLFTKASRIKICSHNFFLSKSFSFIFLKNKKTLRVANFFYKNGGGRLKISSGLSVRFKMLPSTGLKESFIEASEASPFFKFFLKLFCLFLKVKNFVFFINFINFFNFLPTEFIFLFFESVSFTVERDYGLKFRHTQATYP